MGPEAFGAAADECGPSWAAFFCGSAGCCGGPPTLDDLRGAAALRWDPLSQCQALLSDASSDSMQSPSPEPVRQRSQIYNKPKATRK